MSGLSDDLKDTFTTLLDGTVKPDLDTFYQSLGDLIRKYSCNTKITVGDMPPSSPAAGDIWINTNP